MRIFTPGIELPFALMTGCDATDTTAGIPDPPEAAGAAPDRLAVPQR